MRGRPCPGCLVITIPEAKLLCRSCWGLLPAAQQHVVMHWWRRRKWSKDAVARAAYARVAQTAITTVREQLRPKQLSMFSEDAGKATTRGVVA